MTYRVSFVAVALLSILAVTCSAAKKPAATGDGQHSGGGGWGFKRITNKNPKLLRVLLIGDSIANGYHQEVAKRLKGKANLDLFITPKHIASPGMLQDLEKALSNGPYRVIHFNESGLHAWPKGAIPEGQYGPLMEKYIKAMKEHSGGASLIWASSTPVSVKGKPTELDVEVNNTIKGFNQEARKVVEKEKIVVNDLYALMIDKLKLMRGDRWHWAKPGSDIQATAVVTTICKVLPAPNRKKR